MARIFRFSTTNEKEYNRNSSSSSNNKINNSGGGGGVDIENRLGKVEVRLDNVDNQLERIDNKLDRFESRFDNIENILSRNTAFLEANLEWLKESNKDIKVMLNKADTELSNSKRHTQIITYSSIGLILAAVVGIAGIWFTTWTANNRIIELLTQALTK